MFTVLLWNKDIGILNANSNINIKPSEKKRLVDLIRINNRDYMKRDQVPILYSNCTNWRGRPFKRLVDFVDSLTEYPNFEQQAH